ncbi:MAG: hypothetical protein AB7P03_03835 [Kofleriaceae bacterium]
MSTDDDDPKVKQLLDRRAPHDVAELEKLFSLPSFQQLEEASTPPPPPEHPEAVASRQRRERVLAAVDPALVESHRQRAVAAADRMYTFKASIDVRVDPSLASLDLGMVERRHAALEPRLVELPPEIEDDLRECTPQALLRDLHRPELEFDKQFEMTETRERVDARATVAGVMTTRWKVSPAERSSASEARDLYRELRSIHRTSWVEVVTAGMLPNRRVRE